MSVAVGVLCLVIGLLLADGVVADDRGGGPLPESSRPLSLPLGAAQETPGTAQPAPSVPPEVAIETTAVSAERTPAAAADDAAQARRLERTADRQSDAQRDGFLLMLLQLLRSPK